MFESKFDTSNSNTEPILMQFWGPSLYKRCRLTAFILRQGPGVLSWHVCWHVNEACCSYSPHASAGMRDGHAASSLCHAVSFGMPCHPLGNHNENRRAPQTTGASIFSNGNKWRVLLHHHDKIPWGHLPYCWSSASQNLCLTIFFAVSLNKPYITLWNILEFPSLRWS